MLRHAEMILRRRCAMPMYTPLRRLLPRRLACQRYDAVRLLLFDAE